MSDTTDDSRLRSLVSWLVLIALVTAVSLALGVLGLPSPLLFGGLVGGLAFALGSSRELDVPRWSFILGQAIIGVTVGASVDFDTLAQLGPDWPAVLLVSVLTLVLSVGAGQLLRLHRGVTTVTASFASVAGGASGMTALAHDLGADDRVVTVIQYLRVLVILLAMPAAVSFAFHAESGGAAATGASPTTWPSVIYAAAAVTLGLGLGKLLRLPSPAVLGALVAAILLSLLPVFGGIGVPTWIQDTGFVLIGVQVGLRFTAESLRAIGRMLPTAILVITIIIVGCAGLGLLLAAVTGVSEVDAYLATTPGGLYAVLATSTAIGGNVTFVTAVQLIRLLLVLLVAPFLARWLVRR